MTHAWLFTGPPGSGRSVAARAFAAALLCANQGCGECSSCHQVAVGGHADLLLIRPDGLSYGVRRTRDLVLRAAAVTEELDIPERDAMRRAFGEGSTGRGVATAVRGAAGALKELEDRQKSRATRVKRDALDRALLDLASFYRDVLAIQLGADVELANVAQRDDLDRVASAAPPETTVRRIEAIMKCRERVAASVAPLLAVEEMTLALATR
jgi:DNA polymerase III gamma/tau subunit